MSILLVAAVVLSVALQTGESVRSQAERLARSGKTAEATALFEQILKGNPADVDAQLGLARLEMRAGRTSDAEARFRSVLAAHPADVDARIGLGSALTRTGRWDEALTVLRSAEPDAGGNSDLFDALGRAYRRAGDDRHAIDYFGRAKTLAPGNADIISAYEAVARTYGHQILFEGFVEDDAAEGHPGSGTLAGSLRVAPRVHLGGEIRLQRGPGYSDALAGADVLWVTPGATTVEGHVFGGSGNTSLPTTDVLGELVHYRGGLEIGGNVRWLSYAGARVIAASPIVAWSPDDRWRFDTRYTYSQSRFDATGQSSGDSSILVRQTCQTWRRVAIIGAYAYGIESFENLTADRLGSIGGSTIAGSLRVDTPSVTRITGTWEHQWRSNDTTLDRFTISIVQSIP